MSKRWIDGIGSGVGTVIVAIIVANMTVSRPTMAELTTPMPSHFKHLRDARQAEERRRRYGSESIFTAGAGRMSGYVEWTPTCDERCYGDITLTVTSGGKSNVYRCENERMALSPPSPEAP